MPTKKWICGILLPQGVRDDWKEIRQGQLPARIEVSMRVTVSSLLGYILGMGDFPDLVPPSQRAMLAMLAPNLSLLFPSLMFSVGAIIFPAQVMVTALAVVFATLLLTCAAGVGLGFYIFAYFVLALFLSGARFKKETGNITTVLVMVVALNSLYIAETASESGVAFVGSLWTDGTFPDAILAFVWICVCLIAPRILPPFRTARSMIVEEWLPKSLEDLAQTVEFNALLCKQKKIKVKGVTDEVDVDASTLMQKASHAPYHEHTEVFVTSKVITDPVDVDNIAKAAAADGTTSPTEEVEITTANDPAATTSPDDPEAPDQPQASSGEKDQSTTMPEEDQEETEEDEGTLEERHKALIARLIKTKASLDGGSIAGMTAFEPRPFHFIKGPPVCSWKVLQTLIQAVDRMILASLAMVEVWRSADGFSEDVRQRFMPQHQQAAANLLECAKALREGSRRVTGTTTEAEDNGNPEDPDKNCRYGYKTKDPGLGGRVDPSGYSTLTKKVIAVTNDWADAYSGSPDWTNRSCMDKEAREARKANIMPWIGASGLSYITTIFYTNVVALFQLATWRSIFTPPYRDLDKFFWCIKFAVGITALVAMHTYWDAFGNLEVQVQDNGEFPESAHFAGWTLIAYAMCTTQTAEGSVKKGLLRLLGTVAGGFWGWVAIGACGEDNIVGLIVWMTVFTFPVAYSGLGRGDAARMGVTPDYGFGPAYFLMTQALVVIDVYIGAGGKNDITVNRILANGAGIVVAMLLAILPVSLYGGNPKYANEILELERTGVIQAVRLLLNHVQSSNVTDHSAAAALAQEIDKLREQIRQQGTKWLADANGYYSDSAKLAALPLWRVDPMLKTSLDGLKYLGSWTYMFVGYAVDILEEEGGERWKQFLADEKSQKELAILLEGLESSSFALDAPYPRPFQPDEEGSPPRSFESKVFVNNVRIASHKMKRNSDRLSTIKWGVFGRQ